MVVILSAERSFVLIHLRQTSYAVNRPQLCLAAKDSDANALRRSRRSFTVHSPLHQTWPRINMLRFCHMRTVSAFVPQPELQPFVSDDRAVFSEKQKREI